MKLEDMRSDKGTSSQEGYKPLSDAGHPIPPPASLERKKIQGEWLCSKEPPVIDPDVEWKQSWDLLILVLILYSAAAIPVEIAFEVESTGWQWGLEAAFSLCFLLDLGFNFNLGYYSDGILMIERKLIIPRYMQGWFWIDGPSSVPVELIELYLKSASGSETPSGLAVLRILRMFRLVRLLRLLKEPRSSPPTRIRLLTLALVPALALTLPSLYPHSTLTLTLTVSPCPHTVPNTAGGYSHVEARGRMGRQPACRAARSAHHEAPLYVTPDWLWMDGDRHLR